MMMMNFGQTMSTTQYPTWKATSTEQGVIPLTQQVYAKVIQG